MPKAENPTVVVRCNDCGHKQAVTAATVDERGRAYFGSAYSHCDKCDGPTTDLGEPGRRIVLQVRVRDTYGERRLYPANVQAEALASISGTKTLSITALRIAKQHLGAIVVCEESDAAYVAALLE